MKYLILILALLQTTAFAATSNLNFTSLGVSSGGQIGTDWVANNTIIVPNNFGTVTSEQYFYRRVGDSMQVRGTFISGNPPASTASFSLNGAYTINLSKVAPSISNKYRVGEARRLTTGANDVNATNTLTILFSDGSDNTKLFLASTSTSDVYDKVIANAIFGTGNNVAFEFTVPITGWTSGGSGGVTAQTSQILVSGGNGFGSTNTKIRRFTTTVTSTGTDITYADSATLGNSFTINTAGVYCMQYNDSKSSGTANHGISVNSTQLTTSINAITNADLLHQASVDGSLGVQGVIPYCGIFAVNDVIRAHTDGTQDTAGNSSCRFKITKVGN